MAELMADGRAHSSVVPMGKPTRRPATRSSFERITLQTKFLRLVSPLP